MYLRVRNFEKYQNADIFKKSNGRPPWVKFYVALLDDEQLLALPYPAQLLFDRLLLVAAETRNVMRDEPEWIAKRTGMDSKTIVKSLPLLLKGAWLRKTKTPRRTGSQSEANLNAKRSNLEAGHKENLNETRNPGKPASQAGKHSRNILENSLEALAKDSPPRREEKKNAPKERSSSSYRSKEATPATASANGAAAGSPRRDTKPEHQPLNVPHTPAGAEAYVRNVGWHDDPDLVSTLRRTYNVRDHDELERLLSLAENLAAP